MPFILNNIYKHKYDDSYISIRYIGQINIYLNETDYKIDSLINDIFPVDELPFKNIYLDNKL
jgi:hypothetical protein